jgi:hypothetical protein
MHIVPKDIERFLKRYGGLNPFGLPKWRLIVASDRMVKEAGVWRDWAPGLSNAEKGGLNFSPNPDAPGCNYQRYDNKPIRVVTEMREVRKYPQSEGWILERWFPASAYGTEEEWYSFKAVDGITSMLGPYPECGDYEFIYGPWVRVPGVDVLERRIGGYVNTQLNKKGTPAQRAREYSQRYQEQEELDERKRKAEYEAQMRDVLTPMNSLSLEASRWRQDLAARTGNANEHIGAVSRT